MLRNTKGAEPGVLRNTPGTLIMRYRTKGCKHKLRFETREEALAKCAEYDARVAMSFTIMEAFFCEAHECYHIGHGIRRREYGSNKRTV